MSKKSLSLLFLSALLGGTPLMAVTPQAPQAIQPNMPYLKQQLEAEQRNKTNATLFGLSLGDQQDYLIELYRSLPEGVRDNIYPLLGSAAVATLGILWWAFGRRAQPGRSAQAAKNVSSALATATSSSSSGSSSLPSSLSSGQASSSSSSSSSSGSGVVGGSLADYSAVPAAAAIAGTNVLIRVGTTVINSSADITGDTRAGLRTAIEGLLKTLIGEEINAQVLSSETIQASFNALIDNLTNTAVALINKRRMIRRDGDNQEINLEAMLQIQRELMTFVNLTNSSLVNLLNEFNCIYAAAISAQRDFEVEQDFRDTFSSELSEVLLIRRALAELDERLVSSDLTERQAAFEELKAACKKAIEDKARELNKAEQERQLEARKKLEQEEAEAKIQQVREESERREKQQREEAARRSEEFRKQRQQEEERELQRQLALYTPERLIAAFQEIESIFIGNDYTVRRTQNGAQIVSQAAREIRPHYEDMGRSDTRLISSDLSIRKSVFDSIKQQFSDALSDKFNEKVRILAARQQREEAERRREEEIRAQAERVQRLEEQRRREEQRRAQEERAAAERKRQEEARKAEELRQQRECEECQRREQEALNAAAQPAREVVEQQRREQGNTGFTPIAGQAAPRVGYGVDPNALAEAQRKVLGRKS